MHLPGVSVLKSSEGTEAGQDWCPRCASQVCQSAVPPTLAVQACMLPGYAPPAHQSNVPMPGLRALHADYAPPAVHLARSDMQSGGLAQASESAASSCPTASEQFHRWLL